MRSISPARLAAMLVCLAALLAAGRCGPLQAYVQEVKSRSTAAIAFRVDGRQDLLEWIRAEAPNRRIEPQNAVIDNVWKAIPGYNGREVDVEATYGQARALGVKAGGDPDAFPWVYKVLRPKVGLDDLGPSPIYRGNPNKPMVGLMINVAWGNEYLPSILDTLEKEKVHATFFFDGSWLSKNGALAQEIVRKGHEASNHAYSHPDMSRLSPARQRDEIAKTESLLKTKLGVSNRWFAPPSGDFNEKTVEIASEYGLKTVLWTLDTIDWKNPPASGVVVKVSARAQAGTLILMHPTPTTKDALPGIIRAIRAKGLVPGTVAETLSAERLDRDAGK